MHINKAIAFCKECVELLVSGDVTLDECRNSVEDYLFNLYEYELITWKEYFKLLSGAVYVINNKWNMWGEYMKIMSKEEKQNVSREQFDCDLAYIVHLIEQSETEVDIENIEVNLNEKRWD